MLSESTKDHSTSDYVQLIEHNSSLVISSNNHSEDLLDLEPTHLTVFGAQNSYYGKIKFLLLIIGHFIIIILLLLVKQRYLGAEEIKLVYSKISLKACSSIH